MWKLKKVLRANKFKTRKKEQYKYKLYCFFFILVSHIANQEQMCFDCLSIISYCGKTL